MSGGIENAVEVDTSSRTVILWLHLVIVVAAATTLHVRMLCPPALPFFMK